MLDLDNTLWGGVVGEDGVDHLSLGPEDAKGEAYQEFQRYIKAQKQLGILLNVASKKVFCFVVVFYIKAWFLFSPFSYYPVLAQD